MASIDICSPCPPPLEEPSGANNDSGCACVRCPQCDVSALSDLLASAPAASSSLSCFDLAVDCAVRRGQAIPQLSRMLRAKPALEGDDHAQAPISDGAVVVFHAGVGRCPQCDVLTQRHIARLARQLKRLRARLIVVFPHKVDESYYGEEATVIDDTQRELIKSFISLRINGVENEQEQETSRKVWDAVPVCGTFVLDQNGCVWGAHATTCHTAQERLRDAEEVEQLLLGQVEGVTSLKAVAKTRRVEDELDELDRLSAFMSEHF